MEILVKIGDFVEFNELPAEVVALAPGANLLDVQSIWAGVVFDTGLFLLL